MIQVNRIYLIFNRLVTKKFLVDTSVFQYKMDLETLSTFLFFEEVIFPFYKEVSHKI